MCERGALVVRDHPQFTAAVLMRALLLISGRRGASGLAGDARFWRAGNESSFRDETCMIFEKPSRA